MKMDSKFNTLAMAIGMASGPAQGIGAFIGFVLAYSSIRFCLVLSDRLMQDEAGGPVPTWVKDEGKQWLDCYGNHWPKRGDESVLQTVTGEDDFHKLDWKLTGFYVEDGTSGWLDPAGNFWGCCYGGHCSLARWVIKMDYYEMEKAGWVHVDCAGGKGLSTFRVSGEPTPAQDEWLSKNGHDLDPFGRRARKREEAARYTTLGGVRIDKDADKAAYERMMAKAGIKPKPRYSDDY